jgi:hypothetical protein
MKQQKPIVFIGSSVEQLPVARAVNAALDHDAICSLWTHGFGASEYTLESLESEIRKSDFAVFILAADDITVSRGRKTQSPRDNVVFELGISIGVLTRRRAFILVERGANSKVPTDLLGVTLLTFERRNPLAAAVEAACNAIREQLLSQGPLPRLKTSENIIAHADRSFISTGFVGQSLRRIATFAGDLSWLAADLPTYQLLRKRGVEIRFLTDTPSAQVISKAKKLGIAFRQYPNKAQSPLKATISDYDSEMDSRALVVRRHVPPHAALDGSPYQYWMRIYRGTDEYPVIRAFSMLFESIWARAKQL